MAQKFANAARGLLSAGINNSTTTVEITEGGSLFPVASGADWFKCVLQDETGIEIVTVTGHTSGSNTFTVVRGQEGTTARSFALGSVFGQRVTAADMETAVAGGGGGGGDMPAVRTPINATPASGATDVLETPTLTGSIYLSLYGLAQNGAQFQVSTVSGFDTVLHDSGTLGAVVSYALPAAVLVANTSYWWRARYRDSDNVWSAWSAGTSFTTATAFNNYITTPTATPGAFGDALDGGFYAGMIWGEVTTSSTSRTLGTGSTTFTTAVNMSATPLFYAGQSLEVRSRANPNNRFQGTVTGAFGTTLTLNVTSITGSGTFADWSIMSQYRVIVAPKSSGENASIAIKNANTAFPTACQTLNEGMRATQAMRDADNSTVYPAAHWARALSISDRTDWYIPARDELEFCWRNLKPVTANNHLTDRPNAPTAVYLRDGAFADSVATNGTNNNSSPAGAAYTTTVPAQVAATTFRIGGAEAFESGAGIFYLSATEYSSTLLFGQWFATSSPTAPGGQTTTSKSNAYRVRAVRRSII